MFKRLMLAATLALLATPAMAAPVIGELAPPFTAKDADGKDVSLSDFRGKTVVLEWTNDQCPYVKKHYGSGNMQRTQEAAVSTGAVWLSVISSAEGKQGHLSGAVAKTKAVERNSKATDILLDSSGEIGRAYDAKTTPHMFVINGEGKLVYAGGIDDKPTADPADIPAAKNYVLAALDNLGNGQPVAEPESEPYGCSIKY